MPALKLPSTSIAARPAHIHPSALPHACVRPLARAAALAAALVAPLAGFAADQDCAPATLAALGRHLHVARLASGGVLKNAACKPAPWLPGITLAVVAWDIGKEDRYGYAVAELDASNQVVAAMRDENDEDAVTQLDGLSLDTAPYELAPGVRAFGVDFYPRDMGCGEGGFGPSRTLYVRDGAKLRVVLDSLSISQFMFIKGNRGRCQGPGESGEAVAVDFNVTIGLGKPGKGGWRDLELTAKATRDDRRGKPAFAPLHLAVPYGGEGYDLTAWTKAFDKWAGQAHPE